MQCFHCGRAVYGTTHKPKSYKVDYYRLHTGRLELDYLVNPKQDGLPLRYLRLTQPVDIFTCVECYARPQIRQKLADDITGRRPLFDMATEGDNGAKLNGKG